MKISVVISLFNSAPHLPDLYEGSRSAIRTLGEVGYEFVFVNDCGPDDSLAVAKELATADPNIIVVDLANNYGQAKALMYGMAQATGDYVCIMDSDMEENPAWIALFYEEMLKKKCDAVYGIDQPPRGGIFLNLGRLLFYKLVNFASGTRLPERICTSRIMTRNYVEALLTFEEREIYLGGLLNLTGFTQLPVYVGKSVSSRTNYSFYRRCKLSFDVITGFTARPLMWIPLVGAIFMIAAILWGLWLVFIGLALDIELAEWMIITVGMLLIGGVTLLCNGLIAIYVARIFNEVKQRPRVVVREVFRGSSVEQGESPGKRDTTSRRESRLPHE